MSAHLSKLRGRRVIASVSGGKDSAALSLWLTEQGIEHDRVFLDTGWEHASTYDYLRGPLTAALGPIVEVRAPRGFADLVQAKGTFPSRARRWCTQELKVKPMAGHLRALMDAGAEVVNAVGIRAEESAARAAMPEWEWSEALDCETWRPLIAWSEQQVIDAHARHGLKPNPLYLLGAQRVGCWPCIYARKAEVHLVADVDPARIQEIGALERELSKKAGTPRALFAAPLGRVGVWPIEEVVEWSRTTHGGQQFDLLPPDPDAGCMRWGLCETRGGEP